MRTTLRLTIAALLLAAWPAPAAAQLDVPTNAAACPVSTGYDNDDTSIVVATGCGASLPTAATNYAWCNVTDNPVNCKTTAGVLDTSYEIVRCTRSSDTLTCTRAQEGTSGVNHNTGGKTYWLFAFTAKTIGDINTALGATFLTTSTNSVLTNEAVLAGTANQVIVTGSTLSTPQNIHTAATPTFGGLTLGSVVLTPATDVLELRPSGANHGLLRFRTDFGVGPDTVRTQTLASLYGEIGNDTVHGANYHNPIYRFGAVDSSGNRALSFEIGAEGHWTNAGGFTEKRAYLWQFDPSGANGKTVWYIQQSTPDIFKFGSTGAGNAIDVQLEQGLLDADGRTISTDADGTVASADFAAAFTKNDTNTRAFPVTRIRPTLNFGGSNTNTTVNLLQVDSVNTSTTGATVNLLNIGTGGAERFVISSGGTFTSRGADGASTAWALENHQNTLTPNTTLNNITARKSSGTFATPLRTQSGDPVFRLAGGGYSAVDDSTTAVVVAAHRAALDFVSSEDWTSTAQGMILRFRTTAAGGTSTGVKAMITEQGLDLNAGGTGATSRGTTSPTNALNLFDGTAPVGTLANGGTLYSASGELLGMDAGGNPSNLTAPFTSTVQGIVPASGGGTSKFMRADGTWAVATIDNANTSAVTANAADTYLTGSALTIGPVQKAGTTMRWRMVATKTAAGTAAATVIVRFGTAGTTGDTARNTFTLSAATAATDTGHFEVTCVVRSINASTGVVACGLDVTHANSTTGLVSANETNVFSVVSGNFDNTSTSLIAGISVNPGTAGVWTFELVTAEARNLQ